MEGITNHICYQIYKDFKGRLGSCRTLLSRTPPPSWIALSSPADADTDASSGLAASRCAALSAAPMVNNHTSELSLPYKTDNSLPGRPQDYSLLNIQYPERPDMKQQRSSAPRWPGSAVMRSEEHQTLFRTVGTTSPQPSHGARLSASQAVLVEIICTETRLIPSEWRMVPNHFFLIVRLEYNFL